MIVQSGTGTDDSQSEYVTCYVNQDSANYFLDKAIGRVEESARKLEKMELKVRMYFAFSFFSGLVIGLSRSYF